MADEKGLQAGQQVFQGKQDEKILVVPRSKLFSETAPSGLMPIDFAQYQEIIAAHGEYIWRSHAESDPAYKQIIPYLVFMHDNKLFLMQRRSTSSEMRLRSKYTLGIGGHVRQEDVQNADILSWSKREFEEEISYHGAMSITGIGLLNQEHDFVGQVHTGFVFLLQGTSDLITVREELASGMLLSFDECQEFYDRMESWSQIVFDYLKAQRQ